jgi:CubicO group peptidase (beta-lactamase class C family)
MLYTLAHRCARQENTMLRSLIALAMAAVSLGAAAADSFSLLPPRVEQAITARIAAGEYPSMIVAVVDGDRSHVYGFGKLDNGKAPDAGTIFQIGSITKTFTATLLADAVEKGEVKLDTPVAKLLPGFTIPSRNGKTITLGQLAMQDSGLPRLPSNMLRATSSDPYAEYDAAKLKAFLAGYELPRDPGAKYEYSNLGLGLLGYALAQHAGTSYGKLLQSRILEPLGMSATSTTFEQPLGPHWALGHDEQGKPVQPWHFDALAGCGAINSTGADMLRWLEANMGRGNGALQAAMRLAHQPRHPISDDERIGLAWMTHHDKQVDVTWHSGMTGGYASFIGFTTDGKRGVVILTNAQQSVDDLGFGALLADALLAPVHQQAALSAQQLQAYVGEYQLAPGFVLTIMRQGGQLFAQATGQGAFPIFPSATDKFFAKITDIRIDFERDGDGKVNSLVLHQNGHDVPAPKLDAAAAAKAGGHHAVQLDAATLRQYVGRYQLAPGVIFDITLQGSQLTAQLTGQPAIPVYASAKDEFYYTVVDAQLSFKRDRQGKVDAVVLHQNGADQIAQRIR